LGNVLEPFGIKQCSIKNYSYSEIENILNKVDFFEKILAERKGFVATGNLGQNNLNKGVLGNFYIYNQEFSSYLNEKEKEIYFDLLSFLINNMQTKINIANQKNNIYIPFSLNIMICNGINDFGLMYNFQIESKRNSLPFNNKERFENLISDVCCKKKYYIDVGIFVYINFIFIFHTLSKIKNKHK